MFSRYRKPSLVIRVVVGKVSGLILGATAFVIVPLLELSHDPLITWGIMFWYATLGAVVGFSGGYDPFYGKPAIPGWLNGVIVGSWMNFVMVLMAYDNLKGMMIALVGAHSVIGSPFWFVLEGAVVGLVIAYLTTRFGGEGKKTIAELD